MAGKALPRPEKVEGYTALFSNAATWGSWAWGREDFPITLLWEITSSLAIAAGGPGVTQGPLDHPERWKSRGIQGLPWHVMLGSSAVDVRGLWQGT